MDFIRILFYEDEPDDVTTEEITKEEETREVVQDNRTDQSSQRSSAGVLVFVLDLIFSVFIALPQYTLVPISEMIRYHSQDGVYIETILIFIFITVFIFLLFQLFRRYIYAAMVLGIAVYFITYEEKETPGSFLNNFFQDYNTVIEPTIHGDHAIISFERLKKRTSDY